MGSSNFYEMVNGFVVFATDGRFVVFVTDGVKEIAYEVPVTHKKLKKSPPINVQDRDFLYEAIQIPCSRVFFHFLYCMTLPINTIVSGFVAS